MKLAIVTTHPIQYNAPVFELLSKRNIIQSKVFYTWGQEVMSNKYDPGFKREVQWDIPLLDGYVFEWVKNISKNKGSHHFRGIITPHLNSTIEEWGADAILIFGWNYHSHLSCMRYFKGKIPVYFRGDSTLLDRNSGGLKNVLKSIFLRWMYKHVDKAFFVGSENKKYFKRFGLKDEQLIYAPHSVDNDKFAKITDSSIRIQLGIQEDEMLFLFAGKFQQKKNPLLLINAFSALYNTNSHLLFVGNGELEVEMKKKVTSLPKEIQNKIHFLDFFNQSQIPALYANCDVFVLPSQGPGETWGLSVNEAMASGKAVIVSNKCGCAKDLISEGENGFVFSTNDLMDLKNKMSMILSRQDAKMLGNKSLKKISEFIMMKFIEELEKETLYARKITPNK